jgi:predicted GNAT family acetyltransferase
MHDTDRTPGGAPVLRRLDDAGRYELDIDGETVAHATFHRLGDAVIVIPHTEVDPSLRGHGIGAVLVGAVLDDVRQRGERVVPRCWYVAQYLDEHPDYLDVVATA